MSYLVFDAPATVSIAEQRIYSVNQNFFSDKYDLTMNAGDALSFSFTLPKNVSGFLTDGINASLYTFATTFDIADVFASSPQFGEFGNLSSLEHSEYFPYPPGDVYYGSYITPNYGYGFGYF